MAEMGPDARSQTDGGIPNEQSIDANTHNNLTEMNLVNEVTGLSQMQSMNELS